jgi:hypothetical protein
VSFKASGTRDYEYISINACPFKKILNIWDK